MPFLLAFACLLTCARTLPAQWPHPLPDSVFTPMVGYLRLGDRLRPGQVHLPFTGDTIGPALGIPARHLPFEAHPGMRNAVLKLEVAIDDESRISCVGQYYGPDAGFLALAAGLRSAFGTPRFETQDHFGSSALWGDNSVTWSIATGSQDPAHGEAVLMIARRNTDMLLEDPNYRPQC